MKIAQSINRPNLVGQIYLEVYKTIKELHKRGYTTFLTGMADGFDMIAAEAVIALKNEHHDVKLIAVIPFRGQEFRYSDTDKECYKTIIDNSDQVVLTSEFYHDRCYHRRNDYLLANCSTLACYYSGLSGGTMYTYNRAQRANISITNIFTIIRDKKDE